MTQITTPRLTLRKPQRADAPALHRAMSEPAAMRYWTRPTHETLAETENFLASMIAADAAGGDEFVIEYQGEVIGKCGMWRRFEVGFLLNPAHWGKGLAHEAMAALIAHLFATQATDHLSAEADPRNAASLGLLARLGFHETHRASRTMQWGEEWCDSIYLRLDRR